MSEPKIINNFPFKTLIWALFATLALFLFKQELKNLLNNTEELTVFGVVIKANKEKALKLESVMQNFQKEIAGLSDRVTDQQNRIKLLRRLKRQLEVDIANCPAAKNNVASFNTQFAKVFKNNDKLKVQSDKLKNVKIFEKRPVLSP